jgi:hypothetical protein
MGRRPTVPPVPHGALGHMGQPRRGSRIRWKLRGGDLLR